LVWKVLKASVKLVAALGALVPVAYAEDPTEDTKNPLHVFYDQGFRLGSAGDAFSLRINGLLQIRYSYVDYDPAIRYNQEDYSNFFVRRARLYFSGHAGSPRFTYFVHVQLEPSQGLNSNDLWVEYSFSDMLRLGAGRNKVALDVSRLERQFAADPDAVIDGVVAPIAKAPDQVDWRVRAMVQLVF
jgi:hypothetical protein